MLNLLRNAVKFSADSDIDVHVLPNVEFVDVEVADRGIGILTEDLARAVATHTADDA